MIEYSDYIKKFYAELELTLNFKRFDYKVLREKSLTEYDRNILQKESFILSAFAVNRDDVNCKDELIEYGKERIVKTSNIFLLSRYHHALYNL